MHILKLLTVAALASSALIAPAMAGPNLVQNGGFENVTGGPGRSHEFGASYIYGQTVDNWTSARSSAFNLVFYPGEANGPNNAATRFNEYGQFLWSSTPSPDGGKFVALDGDTGLKNLKPNTPVLGQYNGPLDQLINGLVSGKKYHLTFNYAGAQYRDRTGATTDQLFATLGGETHHTSVFTNASMGFTGWKLGSLNFTATGTSELLSFLADGAPSGLPPVVLLDGVSLQVPEPAALAIFGLGLAGLGAARLRRR